MSGGKPEPVIALPGTVGSFSMVRNTLAYTYASASDLAQLYVLTAGSAVSTAKRLTDLNAQVLTGKSIAPVETFTFVSNDNRVDVEAFPTRPVDAQGPVGSDAASTRKYPLIVNIHGGPHGQQGVAFNFRNQVYAAHGWATLMVNYRGSTGYGQAFADAVFADQNGAEAQDVLYGVSAALRRYPWIDRDRLGVEGTSYGDS